MHWEPMAAIIERLHRSPYTINRSGQPLRGQRILAVAKGSLTLTMFPKAPAVAYVTAEMGSWKRVRVRKRYSYDVTPAWRSRACIADFVRIDSPCVSKAVEPACLKRLAMTANKTVAQ